MAVVSCRSCGRWNLADELKQRGFACELCGQIIPASDRPAEIPSSRATLGETKQQPAPVQRKADSPFSSWGLLDWYRALRWVAGGLFCIGLGVALMSPAFRANPKELTASDAMPGVAAFIVGIGMLVLFIIPLFVRKKPRSSTTEPATPPHRPSE